MGVNASSVNFGLQSILSVLTTEQAGNFSMPLKAPEKSGALPSPVMIADESIESDHYWEFFDIDHEPFRMDINLRAETVVALSSEISETYPTASASMLSWEPTLENASDPSTLCRDGKGIFAGSVGEFTLASSFVAQPVTFGGDLGTENCKGTGRCTNAINDFINEVSKLSDALMRSEHIDGVFPGSLRLDF